MKIHLKTLTVLFAAIAAAGSACAQTLVYDNSTTDTTYRLMLTNSVVLGQEIKPDSTALASYPYLTFFSFQYYSPNSLGFSGSVQADVSFYHNDGALTNGFAMPGTKFYDSGYFSLVNPWGVSGTNVAVQTASVVDLYNNTGPGTMNLNYNVALPSDFTVVFTLSGLAGSDQAGLAVFGPAQTGTNYGDYWVKDNANNWSLVTNSQTAGGVGLAMQFAGQATPAPEPSVLALGALGALLLARMAKRRQ